MAQLLGWKIEYDGPIEYGSKMVDKVDARTSQCSGPQDNFQISLARLLLTTDGPNNTVLEFTIFFEI